MMGGVMLIQRQHSSFKNEKESFQKYFSMKNGLQQMDKLVLWLDSLSFLFSSPKGSSTLHFKRSYLVQCNKNLLKQNLSHLTEKDRKLVGKQSSSETLITHRKNVNLNYNDCKTSCVDTHLCRSSLYLASFLGAA